MYQDLCTIRTRADKMAIEYHTAVEILLLSLGDIHLAIPPSQMPFLRDCNCQVNLFLKKVVMALKKL